MNFPEFRDVYEFATSNPVDLKYNSSLYHINECIRPLGKGQEKGSLY